MQGLTSSDEKRQTMIYATQHRKLNIEQDKPSQNQGWTQNDILVAIPMRIAVLR